MYNLTKHWSIINNGGWQSEVHGYSTSITRIYTKCLLKDKSSTLWFVQEVDYIDGLSMNTATNDPPISLFSTETSRLAGHFMRETSKTIIGGEIELSFSIIFTPSGSNVLFKCLKLVSCWVAGILSTLDLWCLPQQLFNTLHWCPHDNVSVRSATL